MEPSGSRERPVRATNTPPATATTIREARAMAKTTVKAGKKQSHRFRPGQSGNPKGRAQGSRNKATLAVEELLDGQSKALTQKAVEKALEGDIQALKICLDRICPPRKSRPIQIKLPKVETAADVTAAHGTVIAAMAQADITPDEANTIAGVLEAKRRAIETVEIEERISKLEAQGAGR